jgi:hypothetical protein
MPLSISIYAKSVSFHHLAACVGLCLGRTHATFSPIFSRDTHLTSFFSSFPFTLRLSAQRIVRFLTQAGASLTAGLLLSAVAPLTSAAKYGGFGAGSQKSWTVRRSRLGCARFGCRPKKSSCQVKGYQASVRSMQVLSQLISRPIKPFSSKTFGDLERIPSARPLKKIRNGTDLIQAIIQDIYRGLKFPTSKEGIPRSDRRVRS